MPALVSPRLLRRGLEVFAAISVIGFGGLLLYGNNFSQFLDTMAHLKWGWVLLGAAVASLDWLAGGLRIWVLVRHVYPKATFKGSILAGGLNTWGSYLTPSGTGGGAVMIYALKRDGVPIPEAMIASLMSFVATVVFFAIAGPTALILGAGRSLQTHGIVTRSFTLYDLFSISLTGFIAVGSVMVFMIVFPSKVNRIAQRVITALERRGNPHLANRIQSMRDGIDRSHECIIAFFKGKGWIAMALSVLISAGAFANRLVAGYLVLRMLGIHAHFVDVLLLQTLISFLLYFAPTPGGSGLAEILSAAVMSIYVPRELTPSYILLWRIMVSYLTVVVGSVIFWYWLKGAEHRPREQELKVSEPAGTGSS